jgi:acyl-coenzyme A synthetase/AMP-(fatty) acid ligase/thioesterase domain-containing protein/acyl carrier protein
MREPIEMGQTLVAQLERQFQVHSARRALKSAAVAWTYRELGIISARCAAAICQEIGDRSAPVALLMAHDAPLIAAIAGVLRSGGFYLALNPSHRAERGRQIVEEIRPKLIIADSEYLQAARNLRAGVKVFCFDEVLGSAVPLTQPTSLSDQCALFYTSGSSQKPKAIVYGAAATLHNVTNYSRALCLTPEDRLTLLSPCSSAASVSSILGAWLNGACLFPFNPVREGLHKMQNWIDTDEISVLHAVPSLFRRFLQSLRPGEVLSSVRAVKLGGEPLFPADVQLFREHFPRETILINGLGLTEANGNVCHFCLRPQTQVATSTVPIGKPLAGIEIKLLADHGRMVAPGEIGEIALRGDFLSPGFWTGDGVREPVARADGWLRTGDLARCDSAGNYEHVGRKDDQLKLRGLWVSLAEIEAALMQIPGVREAAAVAVQRADGDKQIAAFVSGETSSLADDALRSRLRQNLPSHSVPRRCFVLSLLPLLANGKIDRMQLSEKAARALAKKTCSPADPDDPLELQLVRIWQKVLDVSVQRTDDFFALGGDSLAAVTMLAAVDKIFGVDLPVSALLEAATLEKLAALIRGDGWSAGDLRLVALQLCGKKPPLYCVPGAGSEALALRELARHLGEQQPFFAFQPAGLDGRASYLRSVEEMAALNLHALREQKPKGSYHLCGTSFGGVVAFEMARRLIAEGEQVPFLALLDTYGGEYPRARNDLGLRKKLRLALRYFLPVGQKETLSWPQLRKGLTEWYQRRLVDLDLRFDFRPLPRPYELRFLYLQEACFAARRRYKLQAFPGRLHLFRIEEQPSPDLFHVDPYLGWKGMAEDGIEIHELPGKHGEHLREPYVRELARELIACLARVESELAFCSS